MTEKLRIAYLLATTLALASLTCAMFVQNERTQERIDDLYFRTSGTHFAYAGTMDSTDGRTYALLSVDPPRVEQGMYSETDRYEVGKFTRKLDTIRVPMTVTKNAVATGDDAKYYYDKYGLPRPGGVK